MRCALCERKARADLRRVFFAANRIGLVKGRRAHIRQKQVSARLHGALRKALCALMMHQSVEEDPRGALRRVLCVLMKHQSGKDPRGALRKAPFVLMMRQSVKDPRGVQKAHWRRVRRGGPPFLAAQAVPGQETLPGREMGSARRMGQGE